MVAQLRSERQIWNTGVLKYTWALNTFIQSYSTCTSCPEGPELVKFLGTDNDAQIDHVLRQGLTHLTDPATLQDRRAGKEPEGTGTSEKGKQPAAQTKRTRTTSLTQPALLAPDYFASALGALSPDDWSKTWAAGRIMLRRTSKRVKEVVDKMRLPAVVRLSWSFWRDSRNNTEKEKRRGVLSQCRVLVHLDLSGNDIGSAGAGVLGRCRELVHLAVISVAIGLAILGQRVLQ
jgi:hypothetical protein